MSTDISNNYLHNILSEIRDLSNSMTNQDQNDFISLLVNFLNTSNTNENLLSLPFSQTFSNLSSNQLNEVLNRSLNEKQAYKKVINNKGLSKLKKIKYDDSKFETKECVISMEEFKNGDEITQLPCNHIFHTTFIETWLKDESSKCPICRFELDYIEKKNDDSNTTNTTNTTNTIINNNQNGYNQMFSNMEMLYNPTRNLFRPSRNVLINQEQQVNRLINVENSYLINRNLQNAILSSLNSEDYQSSSSDEEIDIFEAFYEDDE